MANRKEELKKAKEAGESIVEKQATSNKEEKPKKEQSLVANKFGNPNSKTYDDVLRENGSDPAKMANWLNNNSGYKAGSRTKKGMEGFGYTQGDDGKWAPKPKTETTTTETKTTTDGKEDPKTDAFVSSATNEGGKQTIDNTLDEIDNISASDKTVATAVQSFTNPETGEVDEGKANAAINEYEQRLVELGAATYDKDGNFILKPTQKGKGWETWATLLSVGLSVIGIAMGVPIIPINFRAVTGKDARDAQIQALQTQYMNIKSDSAKTIDQMNTDVGAGQIAQNNQDALAAQEKHSQATAATKDVIGAQTSAEKELIETRTDEEIRKDAEQFKRDMQRLKGDRDFQIKYAALQQQYAKEMAELQDALSTGSAIAVMKYQNSGFLKDLENMGMSFGDIAAYTAAKNGISPFDKNWNRVNQLVDTVIGGINPFKK